MFARNFLNSNAIQWNTLKEKKVYQDSHYAFGGKIPIVILKNVVFQKKEKKSMLLLKFRVFGEHISRWKCLHFVHCTL